PAAAPFRAISDGALNSLPSVVMKSGYALGISETAFPLARWNNHMVAAAMTRSNINGHGFALVLGASPQTGAGDLGRSGAFPALVTSIAKSSLDASLRAHNFNIGAPIDIRLFINNDLLPQQKVDITRVSSGTEAPGHTTTPGMLLSNPESVIQNPGIYLLNAGDQKIWIAVNPPVNESSQLLAPVDSLKNLFRISSQNKQNDLNGYIEVHEEKNGLWLYCFLASIILLTVELVLSSNPRQPAEQATA
ncbi:MAG: hypothetical protein ACRD63_10200, partial [Pyrinomonadaceae bacterium]